MKIHFSGIGGIGISALARYYLKKGHQVTGSDLCPTSLTQDLENEGITMISAQENIPINTNFHIYSEAVPKTDIQRLSAKKNKIASLSYFKALGVLSSKYKTIAVCGTHGKTTTTAMIGSVLQKIQTKALIIVGSLLKEFNNTNIYFSKVKPDKSKSLYTKIVEDTYKSQWFVVEACEYRENFLWLNPFGVVLLNCDWDHIDYYKTFEVYKNAFIKLVKKIPKKGFLIVNFDDPVTRSIAIHAKCTVIPVSPSKIENLSSLKIPGVYNQYNAEFAKLTCQQIDNNKRTINKYIEAFSGIWRRFDILGQKKKITIIDDYAHHPIEIKTVLKTLLTEFPQKKLCIIFQPHQYSRTYELLENFITAFDLLLDIEHILYITDIYEARDNAQTKQAVNSKILTDKIKERGLNCIYSGNYEETFNKMINLINNFDILFTMGAGPVNELSEKFFKNY